MEQLSPETKQWLRESQSREAVNLRKVLSNHPVTVNLDGMEYEMLERHWREVAAPGYERDNGGPDPDDPLTIEDAAGSLLVFALEYAERQRWPRRRRLAYNARRWRHRLKWAVRRGR